MRPHNPIVRNATPPEVARQFGVATAKVIGWIRDGELAALNLARRGSTRPRYSITPEALEQFKRARAVVPSAPSTTPRLRRKPTGPVREYV